MSVSSLSSSINDGENPDKLISILQKRNNTLQTTVEELNKEKAVVARNLLETDTTCRELEQLAVDKEKEIKVQRDTHNCIVQELQSQMEAEKHKHARMWEELQSQMEALRRRHNEENGESQINAARKRGEELTRQIDAFREKEVKYNAYVEATRRREENLTGQIDALRRAEDEFKVQLSAARKREEEFNRQLDACREKEEKFKAKIDAARLHEENLTGQIDSLCRQEDLYRSQLKSCQRLEDELKGEVEAFRCQEEELQGQIDSFQRNEDNRRGQVEAYRRHEEELVREIEQLKSQLKSSTSSTPNRNGDVKGQDEMEKKNRDLVAWAEKLGKQEKDLSAFRESLMSTAGAVEKAVKDQIGNKKMQEDLDRKKKTLDAERNALVKEKKALDEEKEGFEREKNFVFKRSRYVEIGLQEILETNKKLNTNDFSCCRPDHIATLIKETFAPALVKRILELSSKQKCNVETLKQLKKLVEETIGAGVEAVDKPKPLVLKSQDVVDDVVKVPRNREKVVAAAAAPPPQPLMKQQPIRSLGKPRVPTETDSTKDKVLNYLAKNGSLNRPEEANSSQKQFPSSSGRANEKQNFGGKPAPSRPGSSAAFNANDDWEESPIPAALLKQQPQAGKRTPAQVFKAKAQAQLLKDEEWD